MDLYQADAFSEVVFDGLAVVHVHEFGRNKPNSQPVVGEPLVGNEQKVTVKTGKPAQLQTGCLVCQPA